MSFPLPFDSKDKAEKVYFLPSEDARKSIPPILVGIGISRDMGRKQNRCIFNSSS